MKQIDTCGKLCPQPLMMTKREIEASAAGDEIEVVTDNATAFTNLTDYLQEIGVVFTHQWNHDKGSLRFIVPELKNTIPAVDPYCPASKIGKHDVIVIKGDRMGQGSDQLGAILLRAFINSLVESEQLPETIILYNSGVMIALKDTDTALSLEQLESKGVTIMSCGTCLDFFQVKDQLAVGIITNMYKITELLTKADKIIYP